MKGYESSQALAMGDKAKGAYILSISHHVRSGETGLGFGVFGILWHTHTDLRI